MSEEKAGNPPTQVTSLEDIRKKASDALKGELISLPSGIVLRLKRPNISKLLRDKQIPSNLVNAAIRLVSGKEVSTAEELSENIQVMENVLKQSILEPVEMTDEDIINLSDEDKGSAFLFIQKGVTDLEPFRKKPASETPAPSQPPVSGKKAE